MSRRTLTWLIVSALALPIVLANFAGVNGSTCDSFNQPCTFHTDCCSNNCVNHKCALPAGMCEIVGAPCADDAECCQQYCVTSVDGVRRCSHPTQCKDIGASCALGTDCCSLACSGGSCAPPPPLCKQEGVDCAGDAECCTGVCSGTCQGLSSCGTLGELCNGDTACCSGLCLGSPGRCAFNSVCRANEDVCSTSAECCNGVCDKSLANARTGTCRKENACNASNEPCGGTRSCCGTLCVQSGFNGTGLCMPVGGCRVLGEVCTVRTGYNYPTTPLSTECCSGSCDFADNDHTVPTLYRCAKRTACLQPGEICGGQGASNNCCESAELGCQPTIDGLMRCSPFCRSAGAECYFFSDECCSHICVPDPRCLASPPLPGCSSTGFQCSGECLPITGQACTGDPGQGTCADDLMYCTGGVCTNNPPCTSDSDCCSSGRCQNGNCVMGNACSPLGGSCNTPADCCDGDCIGGTCQIGGG